MLQMETFEESLLKWVVKRDQSFLEIESKEFRNLLKFHRQADVIPSADTELWINFIQKKRS